MASVTGITKQEADRIHNASVVGGRMDASGQLILRTRGGNEINAGLIRPEADLNKIYPTGSIFMSTSSVNPGNTSSLGFGTWVAWGQGRVPVGVDPNNPTFNVAEKTGGVLEVKLTALQSGLRTHTHTWVGEIGTTQLRPKFNGSRESSSNSDTPANVRRGYGGVTEPDAANRYMLDSDHSHTVTGTVGTQTSQPAQDAHTNLQPYVTCYMWKRTA